MTLDNDDDEDDLTALDWFSYQDQLIKFNSILVWLVLHSLFSNSIQQSISSVGIYNGSLLALLPSVLIDFCWINMANYTWGHKSLTIYSNSVNIMSGRCQ